MSQRRVRDVGVVVVDVVGVAVFDVDFVRVVAVVVVSISMFIMVFVMFDRPSMGLSCNWICSVFGVLKEWCLSCSWLLVRSFDIIDVCWL